MTSRKTYVASLIVLMALPLASVVWKLSANHLKIEHLSPASLYKVRFHFELSGAPKLFTKAFLPSSNRHQTISEEVHFSSQSSFELKNKAGNKRGVWRSTGQDTVNIGYEFSYQGKAISFQIPEQLSIPNTYPDSVNSFLEASEYIQSADPAIHRLLQVLQYEIGYYQSTLAAIFQYVHGIPSIKTSQLTDALSTLKNQAASCNGKSRLFVALAQAAGMPARTVGGIILETTQKRTSHLWAEVFINGEWVPFDPLNGHYAYLPAHYLQLYKGDFFLISHTPDIHFDYHFDIQKQPALPKVAWEEGTLWGLVRGLDLPLAWLRTILLLPICALVVGLFRNVVGLKTFGVFLPAIMAIALYEVGILVGLATFLSVVLIISLLNIPLEKWGLLYAPKLIIILMVVVLALLGITLWGLKMEYLALSHVIFFPIIIMTILGEKFAKTITQDGWESAFKWMLQTLLVALACWSVFNTNSLPIILIYFPELLSILLAITLLLGKWIGLRLSEYHRFTIITQ